MSNPKRLTLCESDKKITGVCGGIAKYFDLDSTVVRLGMLVLILGTGVVPGLVFYVVAAMVMPKEGEGNAKKE